MTVDTGKVAGRRALHFETYLDLLADAERLADSDVRTLGNWTLGQALEHLARSMDMSIDGASFRSPLLAKVYVRMFMRRRLIHGPMPAGFRLRKSAARQLVPEVVSTAEGLNSIRRAVYRMRSETSRAPSPILGPLTNDEWDSLHLRHAEMHLSFFQPT